MKTKRIQLTAELPLECESLHQLEVFVHAEGQRIKQQMFEKEAQAIIDRQKELTLVSPPCPHCGEEHTIFAGRKPRQLKTLFGEIHLSLPRLQCQVCERYFFLLQVENICGFDSGVNITQALRRIATLCGSSWPYEQAENVLLELTGVPVSHNQIMNLCESEALGVEANQKQTYETFEAEALVETMNALSDYLSEEEKPLNEAPPASRRASMRSFSTSRCP